jgi:hypothetical protein
MHDDFTVFGAIFQNLDFIWMGRFIFGRNIVLLTTFGTFEVDFNSQCLAPPTGF